MDISFYKVKNNHFLPQIFKGASNSSKIGYDAKISFDFKQSPRTSDSVKFTIFPGFYPFTESSFWIIPSTSRSIFLPLSTILIKS